jgi:hypothetical protein
MSRCSIVLAEGQADSYNNKTGLEEIAIGSLIVAIQGTGSYF